MALPECFGLDIGVTSIKIVQVRNGWGDIELSNVSLQPTVDGMLNSDSVETQRSVGSYIQKAVEAAGVKTNKVVFSLPESSIYTRILTGFPKMNESKLDEAILYESRKYLSISIDETHLSWMIVGETDTTLDILVVAASRSLVDRFMNYAKYASLDVVAIETESIANARAVSYKRIADNLAALILDISVNGTDILVVKGKNLIYSVSIGTGINAFSRAIAASFNLDVTQADQYRDTYGLNSDQLQGKILQALDPVAASIVNEAKKTIDFFKSKFTSCVPQKLFVVGEGAVLPGLAGYLNKSLNIEVSLADPFEHFRNSGERHNVLVEKNPYSFSVACGLAMKQE